MNEESNVTPGSEKPATPAAPCIYLKSLKKGNVLLLEGETDIYELTLRYPEHGIVDVSSNHPALRDTAVGQFMFSVRAADPGTHLNAIQRGWAVMLRFRNGEFQTQPILSASVNGEREDGSRWSYNVF